MSKLKRITVFCLIFVLPSLGLAQSSTELFNEGTKAYLAKDYTQAETLFTQSLDKDPLNSTVLTNLALTAFQLGKKPLAVGLLRKALHYEPDLETAQQALRFSLSQMQIKEVPHKIQTYESLRTGVLQPIPLLAYLGLSALSFFAAGWTLISYVGRRKKANEEERQMPGFPVIAVILSSGFILFTSLVFLKIYDSTIPRATIVDEIVSLQTAPGDNQVAITELGGGLEVIVRQTQNDWVQVNYPGSATGWIKKSSVLMTR